MRIKILVIFFGTFICVASLSSAAVFGVVSGIIQDPQGRPVSQTEVTVKAQLSSWQEQVQTDSEGKFSFLTVPAGEYVVSTVKDGFQRSEQRIVVRSGTVTSLTISLAVGTIS